MRVAVTGSDGFIGRHVVKKARELGHTTLEIDHSNDIDVRSGQGAYMVAQADAVIHLAGILGTGELFDHPEEAVETNVLGTLNVLKACEDETRYVGITMPDVWRNVYQATKRCAKDLASAWHQHRGVRVSHVRAFNVYGPGQKYGSPQKIIPTFSVAALAGRAIPIWGDGSQTVDLVYVEDVAQILVEVATKFPGEDETVDAGTGLPLSVNQVAGYVLNAVGREMDDTSVEYRTMRPGETPHSQVVALGEGWDLLGWRPQYRPETLKETVRSYQEAVERLAATRV
jgi:UDP-glucose 4-epimerase